MLDALRHFLTQTGVQTAHPLAFLIVSIYGLSWFLYERETFN